MRIWFYGKFKKERVIKNLHAQEKRQVFLLLLFFFHPFLFTSFIVFFWYF